MIKESTLYRTFFLSFLSRVGRANAPPTIFGATSFLPTLHFTNQSIPVGTKVHIENINIENQTIEIGVLKQ